jgi:hypothetical protein
MSNVWLTTYLLGYRDLAPSVRPIAAQVAEAAPLDGAQWRTILALLAVMAITIFQSIAYYQLLAEFSRCC